MNLSSHESFVVDAAGQSHRVAGRGMLAPSSFVKLILPPIPPDQTPVGPVVSFGVGVGSGGGSGMGVGVGQTMTDPRRSSVASEDEAWDWSGPADVRLNLTYRKGDSPPFIHAFLLRRRKM